MNIWFFNCQVFKLFLGRLLQMFLALDNRILDDCILLEMRLKDWNRHFNFGELLLNGLLSFIESLMIHKINETVLKQSKEQKPKTYIEIKHCLNLPQNANGPMKPTM